MLYFVLSKFDESLKNSFLTSVDFEIPGQFVVETPDGVQYSTTPTTYAQVKLGKLTGIQAMHPDFSGGYIYEEFDNASLLDTGHADFYAQVHKYEVVIPANSPAPAGHVRAKSTTLASVPTHMMAYWQVYSISRAVGSYGGMALTYTEEDPTDLTVEVSVDNGANWDTVTYGATLVPTVPGNKAIMRFTNATAEERYLGYYILLYRL